MVTAGILGRQLHTRRLELGLSQVDVCARAGVSRRWLIQVETGHDTAQLGKVIAVARTLGLDLMLQAAVAQPERNSLDDLVEGQLR